jgi:hypothetical protein
VQAAAAEDFREDVARCSDALTSGASDADGKSLLHDKLLDGEPSAEGEVLVDLRHDPEKNAHRFPGCLIVFAIVSANDKAVYSVAF